MRVLTVQGRLKIFEKNNMKFSMTDNYLAKVTKGGDDIYIRQFYKEELIASLNRFRIKKIDNPDERLLKAQAIKIVGKEISIRGELRIMPTEFIEGDYIALPDLPVVTYNPK